MSATALQTARAILLQKQEYIVDRLIEIDCYDIDTEERDKIVCSLKYLYMYYSILLIDENLSIDEINRILYKLYDLEGSNTSIEILLNIVIDSFIGTPDINIINQLIKIDSALDLNSANAVENRVIKTAIDDVDVRHVDKTSEIGAGLVFDVDLNVLRLNSDYKELVSPVIAKGAFKDDGVTVPAAIWEFYLSDETTPYTPATSNALDVIVEKGVRAYYSIRYSYPTPTSDQALPTSVTGFFGTTLPGPDTYSQDEARFALEVDGESSVTLIKERTGLIIEGGQVVPATGNDTKSTSFSISYKNRSYFGYHTEATISESQILALGTTFLTSTKGTEQLAVTADSTQYTYYIYASELGDLTSVISDGGDQILGAFIKLGDQNITTGTGLTLSVRVYRTNAKGAFTNNNLLFI